MENEPPPKLWARRLCLHLAELKTQTVETYRHEPQWPARPPTRRCQLLLHLLQPPHRQPRVQRASHKRRLPKSHLPSLAARCPQVPALLCVSSYSQPCFAARSGIWPDAVAQPDPVSVVRGRKGFMTGCQSPCPCCTAYISAASRHLLFGLCSHIIIRCQGLELRVLVSDISR